MGVARFGVGGLCGGLGRGGGVGLGGQGGWEKELTFL